MMVPERVRQAHEFRNLSDEFFSAGNAMAGAEMLYGALTQVIIAIAIRRDWTYQDHRQRRQVIRNLTTEFNDPGISFGFGDAQKLHVHFYLNNLADDLLVAARFTTQTLINRLLPLTA